MAYKKPRQVVKHHKIIFIIVYDAFTHEFYKSTKYLLPFYLSSTKHTKRIISS